MAIGDPSNILSRIKSLLPSWFGGSSPNADAVLTGVATNLSFGHAMLRFAKLQTRIATATGGFLDLIGWDIFGARFQRRSTESDDAWRARILPEILRPRSTRPAIIQAVKDLTGVTPVMIEFTNPFDCGSIRGAYIGYGIAGHWGSMLARTQALLNAYRPSTTGIPEVPGWGARTTLASHVLGGFGLSGEWAKIGDIKGYVTDADIFKCVADTQAGGCTIWTGISTATFDPKSGATFGDPLSSGNIPLLF